MAPGIRQISSSLDVEGVFLAVGGVAVIGCGQTEEDGLVRTSGPVSDTRSFRDIPRRYAGLSVNVCAEDLYLDIERDIMIAGLTRLELQLEVIRQVADVADRRHEGLVDGLVTLKGVEASVR